MEIEIRTAEVLVFLGLALQLTGICKGTSSIREFRQQIREWGKTWPESLARRNNSGTVIGSSPMPRLRASLTGESPPNATLETLGAWTYKNITGLGNQTASILEELVKLGEEIHSERTRRIEADKRIGEIFKKGEHAAWFVFTGTLVLGLVELSKLLAI